MNTANIVNIANTVTVTAVNIVKLFPAKTFWIKRMNSDIIDFGITVRKSLIFFLFSAKFSNFLLLVETCKDRRHICRKQRLCV